MGTAESETMFYVGLLIRKLAPADSPDFIICVQSVPFSGAVAFNENHARVAVRRYIRGNLITALATRNDGADEPTDAGHLCRRWMIPGNGPGGFEVDYGDCRK